MDYCSLRRTIKGWSINGLFMLKIVIQNAKGGHIFKLGTSGHNMQNVIGFHVSCDQLQLAWFEYAILKASFMGGLYVILAL